MAITDFVVAESPKDSSLRVHRATCARLGSRVATHTPTPLDKFLAPEARAFRGPDAPVPTIASCCKPNAAKVYLDSPLEAEIAIQEAPAPVPAEDPIDVAEPAVAPDGEPALDDETTALGHPPVEDPRETAPEGFPASAAYVGPAYLWPAARKGATAFLGDVAHKVVATSRAVFVPDAETANALQARFDSAVLDLKAARRDGRFDGVEPYGAAWTKSPRYALEQQIIRDHIAAGAVL